MAVALSFSFANVLNSKYIDVGERQGEGVEIFVQAVHSRIFQKKYTNT
jgi:hypothetical protein